MIELLSFKLTTIFPTYLSSLIFLSKLYPLNLPLLLPPYTRSKAIPIMPLSQVFRTKLITINSKKLSFGFWYKKHPTTNHKKLSFWIWYKKHPTTNNKKLSFGFDVKKHPTHKQQQAKFWIWYKKHPTHKQQKVSFQDFIWNTPNNNNNNKSPLILTSPLPSSPPSSSSSSMNACFLGGSILFLDFIDTTQQQSRAEQTKAAATTNLSSISEWVFLEYYTPSSKICNLWEIERDLTMNVLSASNAVIGFS